MYSNQSPKETKLPSGPHNRQGLRSHLSEDCHFTRRRVHRDWKMGLWVCRTEKNRPRTASLPEEVRDGASFRATRCLLRRTHLRHHSLCQNLRRGRHFLPRFHFPVPVGEQVRYLSSEIPRDYLQPSRPKYLPLLRDRPGRHPCSGMSFSSRLAGKGRWETYVSSLQVLCPRRDGQTTPRVVQYVWSHSWTTNVMRYVVYSGTLEGSGERIPDRENSWGLAFQRREPMYWFVCWLCKHVVKTKARECRLAQRVCDGGAKSGVCPRLRRARRHQAREHRRQPGTEIHCQDAVEQVKLQCFHHFKS